MLSRVADGLYWLSRFVQRAAYTASIVDVQLDRTLDLTHGSRRDVWRRVSAALGVTLPERAEDQRGEVTRRIAFDRESESSILSTISQARENARHTREHISSEMWSVLNRLWLQISRASADPSREATPGDLLEIVSRSARLFSGSAETTMVHRTGWHFIEAGRSMEAADNRTRLLAAYARELVDERSRGDLLEPGSDLLLVELLSCSGATETYSKVSTGVLRTAPILEFLLLDPCFPGSVRFSVERLESALLAIEETQTTRDATRVTRLASKLRARLSYASIDEILEPGFAHYLEVLETDLVRVHEAIHEFYIAYPLSEVLAS